MKHALQEEIKCFQSWLCKPLDKKDLPKAKSLLEVKHTIAWSPPLFSWSFLAFSGPSLSAAAGTLHSPMCYGCMTSLSIWSGTELLPHPFQDQSQRLGCHWLQLHTLWWKHQWLQKKSGCSWYLCYQAVDTNCIRRESYFSNTSSVTAQRISYRFCNPVRQAHKSFPYNRIFLNLS